MNDIRRTHIDHLTVRLDRDDHDAPGDLHHALSAALLDVLTGAGLPAQGGAVAAAVADEIVATVRTEGSMRCR